MTTNYARGRAFEYRTRDVLKQMDSVYVMRAAGSHTKADLIALFPYESETDTEYPTYFPVPVVWLVQCKRDGRLSKSEREELVQIAEATGASAYLAKAGPNGRGVVFERLRRET